MRTPTKMGDVLLVEVATCERDSPYLFIVWSFGTTNNSNNGRSESVKSKRVKLYPIELKIDLGIEDDVGSRRRSRAGPNQFQCPMRWLCLISEPIDKLKVSDDQASGRLFLHLHYLNPVAGFSPTTTIISTPS
ncbi:hypothetical protein RSOLAG1IB_03983 [Rhizoctonia solani AG-1 IB]|uniref:Uncharacterized protein n=1 Tax=Thanatephorus cucumeris (strain AG1-IB / isolate 7/3/14) TaxID=1108050 RepID=A0A0B7FV32_THACB|nr:hypothetical protein RSOLAG1IB_03983 [Rhizoctonia solani AG-1 IB]